VSRKRTFHIPLNNLHVAHRWLVGPVSIRPAGWLKAETARLIARTPPAKRTKTLRAYHANASEIAEEAARWATASVAAADRDEARDRVREVVAVLRLYQRQLTRMNLDTQTFGLPLEVSSHLGRHLVTASNRIASFGWDWQGVIVPWTFTAGMIRQFRTDPRMAWLERALRSEAELELATKTALAFLNMATVLYPPPVRIALQAFALEAILGDDDRNGRRHRVARRAAYLTCGTGIQDETPHGPTRAACFYLEAQTMSQVKTEAKREAELGRHPLCTWYWASWDLFDDRDLVAHEASRDFDHRKAVRFEHQVDEVILAVADWASRTGGKTVAELDAEIDAFVDKGVQDGEALRPRRYGPSKKVPGRSGRHGPPNTDGNQRTAG
jgi:hypothetical protein